MTAGVAQTGALSRRVGVADGPPETGTRWEGATRSACAPLSSLDVANAERPYVASADNTVKFFCALFRQI